MSNENEPKDPNVTVVVEEPKPRKIMLGKRVLRHFQVKTGVQTGLAETDQVSTSDSIKRSRCVGAG